MAALFAAIQSEYRRFPSKFLVWVRNSCSSSCPAFNLASKFCISSFFGPGRELRMLIIGDPEGEAEFIGAGKAGDWKGRV